MRVKSEQVAIIHKYEIKTTKVFAKRVFNSFEFEERIKDAISLLYKDDAYFAFWLCMGQGLFFNQEENLIVFESSKNFREAELMEILKEKYNSYERSML